MGIYTTAERMESLQSGAYDAPAAPAAPAVPVAPKPSAPATGASGLDHAQAHLASSLKIEAPMCFTCGTNSGMRPAGACFVCEHCGSSSGCS